VTSPTQLPSTLAKFVFHAGPIFLAWLRPTRIEEVRDRLICLAQWVGKPPTQPVECVSLQCLVHLHPVVTGSGERWEAVLLAIKQNLQKRITVFLFVGLLPHFLFILPGRIMPLASTVAPLFPKEAPVLIAPHRTVRPEYLQLNSQLSIAGKPDWLAW